MIRNLALATLLLAFAGCANNARVDAFLHDTGQMPDDKASPMPRSTTSRTSTTGGVDLLPTRASTYARADALEYARLWAKFSGKPPGPFGYDAKTDAAVMALAHKEEVK